MMFKGLKVGGKVAVALHRGHAEWIVEKVGRKYFMAGRTEFRLDDGASTSGYSSPRAFTLADRALSLRASHAELALRAVNVVIDYGAKDRRARAIAVYEALKPMIDAEATQKGSEAPR